MDQDREEELTVYLKEYEIISQEIKERINRSDKIIGYGLTVLGVGITYGLKEGIDEIVLVIPFGLFGVLFYAIFNTTAIMALGGYSVYVTEQINNIFMKNVLRWNYLAKPLIHKSISLKCLHACYFILLCLTIFISIRTAIMGYNWIVVLLMAIMIVAGLIALIISLLRLKNTGDLSFKMAGEFNRK